MLKKTDLKMSLNYVDVKDDIEKNRYIIYSQYISWMIVNVAITEKIPVWNVYII